MVFKPSKEIETVLKSLKENSFNPVEFIDRAGAATKYLLGLIPLNATVGVAGSTTIRQLGLLTQLRTRGTRVIDTGKQSRLSVDELARRSLRSDILLASSNAITLDGKLVNTDAIGNKTAGMIFGPKKVILVVGVNKIVRNVDEAFDRIRKIIAPYHSKTKGRKTPCATDGRCTDCNSLERICRVTTIIEKKPLFTDIGIVLVGEDLGLGWDPSWPKERRDKIAFAYHEARRDLSQAIQNFSTRR
jgi:hypothetical protein